MDLPSPNKLFVYGILKRGFGADLTQNGGEFLCPATLHGATLYNLGGIAGLRFDGKAETPAIGELFEVNDPEVWNWMDWLESNGYNYTRKVVTVDSTIMGPVEAWVYEHTYEHATYDEVFEGNEY